MLSSFLTTNLLVQRGLFFSSFTKVVSVQSRLFFGLRVGLARADKTRTTQTNIVRVIVVNTVNNKNVKSRHLQEFVPINFKMCHHILNIKSAEGFEPPTPEAATQCSALSYANGGAFMTVFSPLSLFPEFGAEKVFFSNVLPCAQDRLLNYNVRTFCGIRADTSIRPSPWA